MVERTGTDHKRRFTNAGEEGEEGWQEKWIAHSLKNKMETILSNTPALYFAIALTLGMFALSLTLGIRGFIVHDHSAILIGLALITFFVFSAGFVIQLPAIIVLGAGFLLIAVSLSFSVMHYMMRKRVGKLLFSIPIKINENRALRVILGFLWIMTGSFRILSPPLDSIFSPEFTIPSYYTLNILIICFGLLHILGLPPTSMGEQIGENGILDARGVFYRWDDIESFVWERAVGRLSFKLKSPIQKPFVVFHHIPFELRPEIYPYLQQRLNNLQTISN